MNKAKQDIRSLEEKYKNTDKGVWRLGEYKAFIHVNRDRLPLTDVHVTRLEYLIDNIPLKSLHANATYEQILLCLSIYCIEETTNKTVSIERYRVLNEYGVTRTMYSVVLRNLLKYYRQNQPLTRNNTQRRHCAHKEIQGE